MHATQREKLIMEVARKAGFVSYRELEARLEASPATIRRDLNRLENEGRLVRVHGGAKLATDEATPETSLQLSGTPFETSISRNPAQKRAIGKAAAELCSKGEGVMIDGGTTTLQMCAHLGGLDLQVLTNSLHIVNALLPLKNARILVPSGTVFREQNIILAPSGEDSMPRFHAPKLFMGAASVGPQGVMQADVVLIAAERRLIERADEVILLVDSSKFSSSSGAIVCSLEEIDILITDSGIPDAMRDALKRADVRLIVAD